MPSKFIVPNHWLLMGLKIMARTKAEEGVTEIGSVSNERAVRQMLRYAQLGEECEFIADQLAAMMITPQEAAIELDRLVRKAIDDCAPPYPEKVRCPEVLGR